MWRKCTSFNVWVTYFVWNFKGYLWNSTQNILPIHWKVRFIYNVENVKALISKSSGAFFETPPYVVLPCLQTRVLTHTKIADWYHHVTRPPCLTVTFLCRIHADCNGYCWAWRYLTVAWWSCVVSLTGPYVSTTGQLGAQCYLKCHIVDTAICHCTACREVCTRFCCVSV